MLRALNSSQLALHKRTAQMVTNFISFEDTYTALLDFVSDPFEKVMCQTDVGVRLDVSRPPEQQEALTTSYCKVALQCLVVLA
ncbi:hypothetical protein ECG_07695 [Echinococcus granulosus]|nr:hypothetical protein ECG_07695 [Echinococcus granulosus]